MPTCALSCCWPAPRCCWPQAQQLPRGHCHWKVMAPPLVPRRLRVRAPAHHDPPAHVQSAHGRPRSPSAPADRPLPAPRVRAPAVPVAEGVPAHPRCAAAAAPPGRRPY
ncbi:hypothetical protein G6F65_022533 [Rhizopus arrhizus]|nr:hypothetical protein G6F68_016789 [Rhizopus microsporus]KAG1243245.1 hypothetical protein G6F65_022533 [Rhizopus arrhizus]KAG1390573.1 hypothetical protein G6F58_012951 [Rhizopus delemar]